MQKKPTKRTAIRQVPHHRLQCCRSSPSVFGRYAKILSRYHSTMPGARSDHGRARKASAAPRPAAGAVKRPKPSGCSEGFGLSSCFCSATRKVLRESPAARKRRSTYPSDSLLFKHLGDFDRPRYAFTHGDSCPEGYFRHRKNLAGYLGNSLGTLDFLFQFFTLEPFIAKAFNLREKVIVEVAEFIFHWSLTAASAGVLPGLASLMPAFSSLRENIGISDIYA